GPARRWPSTASMASRPTLSARSPPGSGAIDAKGLGTHDKSCDYLPSVLGTFRGEHDDENAEGSGPGRACRRRADAAGVAAASRRQWLAWPLLLWRLGLGLSGLVRPARRHRVRRPLPLLRALLPPRLLPAALRLSQLGLSAAAGQRTGSHGRAGAAL